MKFRSSFHRNLAGPSFALALFTLVSGSQAATVTKAATGADVSELREIVRAGENDFDIAVVLCGVNDGKKDGQISSRDATKRSLAGDLGSLPDHVP